jgi:hypothetical protein
MHNVAHELPDQDIAGYGMQVAAMYDWRSIAVRTVSRPYADALASSHSASLHMRIDRLLAVGQFFGPIAVAMASLDMLLYWLICLLDPADEIDLIPVKQPP